MSTPVKHLRVLISPRIFSRLSPSNTPKLETNSLTVPKSPLARSLEFNYSPTKYLASPTLFEQREYVSLSPKSPKNVSSLNSINVNNFFDKKDASDVLNINTPRKKEILKNGLHAQNNLDILGRGSFGTVVKGNYKGVDVAAKVVKLKQDLNMQLRETHTLNLLHKNIVKIFDVIVNENQNYGLIIMEFLPHSKQLQSILEEEECLKESMVVKYAFDICRGLAFCHANNILHLDLKPKNILVCENNICKLCDFGNSFKVGQLEVYKHQGTIAYTAPEILLGKLPTTKSDIYSLGITFWQMKHSKDPYSNIGNGEVLIYKVVKFQLRPEVNNICSRNNFTNLYQNCWKTNPAERPVVQEIIKSLEEF